VRYEDDRGGSGEERFQFRTDWRAYLKMRPPLSKWLFGIPEQDRSTLEQEARRVAGHSRRIWIKGKGQPNVEEDLNLKLAFIHSLHFLTSRASKHRNSRPLSPVLRAHDLQNAIPGDQRGERRWRALRTDPLFDCLPVTLGASDRIAQRIGCAHPNAQVESAQAGASSHETHAPGKEKQRAGTSLYTTCDVTISTSTRGAAYAAHR
jgi:hypothetical protein